jgi:hypothetical protein
VSGRQTKQDAAESGGKERATMNTLADVQNEIVFLAATMKSIATQQYEYGVRERAKHGKAITDEVAHFAVRRGIIAAISRRWGWEVESLRLVCADILEDANDHETAAELRSKAKAGR